MSKASVLVGSAVASIVLSGTAAPTVSGVTAQQYQPSNGKVEINFNLSGAGTEGLGLVIWAVDRAAGVTNVAQTLTGDTSYANGDHTVVWDMAADGLSTVSSDVLFGVKYTAPLYCVIDVSAGYDAKSYPVSYLADVPAGGWTDEYKTTKIVMRRIKAGTFMMGSPTTEPSHQSNEAQHKVTLTQDYWIGVFEFTQKQWELVAYPSNKYPSRNMGTGWETRPVESVNYGNIRGTNGGSMWPTYSNVDEPSLMYMLRNKTGIKSFDLPTEAQWEYACRAGTTTGLNSGKELNDMSGITSANLSEVAQYMGCSPSGTIKVGSRRPNAWGLYDMHGNVAEWCRDWYGAYSTADATNPYGPSSGDERVIRGGSCYFGYFHCRSASRYSDGPSDRAYYMDDIGFRVSCSITGTSTEAAFCWTASMPIDLRKKVATPTIAAPASFVGPLTEATIDCPTAGAALHYTLDGTDPTSASPLYSSVLTITKSCVIKVVGLVDGYVPSDIVSLTVTKSVGLGDTLDWPYLTFNASGDAGWTVDSTISHDGGSSLKSGTLADGQCATLTTTVNGKGTLAFWWKASCESAGASRDHASFTAEGATDTLDGESSWVKVTRTFTTAGDHLLTWTYQKDAGGSSGSDCVWIDGFNWIGEDAIPDLGETPSLAAVAEATWGAADPRVSSRIVTGSDYTSFRAWAETVKTADGSAAVDLQTIKASANAWQSYALGSETLLEAPIQTEDLTVEAFTPAGEAGKYEFTVSVEGVKIGDEALKENLKQVFGLEGSGSLDAGSFSSDGVDIVFGEPKDGKVKFSAGPKDAEQSSFFMKVKVAE